MQLFHRAPFVTPLAKATVATIGNFDGMHLGHQALLKALVASAKVLHVASTVILFEPHPAEYFQKAAAPARLMRLREKLHFLASLGIDQVWCLGFDHALATKSATDFVKVLLIEQLNVKQLWVGDDFRFGAGRTGDLALLTQFAKDGAFSLKALPSHQVGGLRVSSSLIRQALAAGDFNQASVLLGRPFRITEKVIKGMQRGRTLNFPTLNMGLHRRVLPFKGVFAVSIEGMPGHAILWGVANLGCRPTVGGGVALLETHVFHFAKEVYGLRLHISFHHKLRAECQFASLTALQAQISQDCLAAQQIFNKKKH